MSVKEASAPTEVDARIGLLLKRAREQAHMTQNELATKIGVTFQQVQKYERGVNRLSASRLERCAEALNLHTSYFFQANSAPEDLRARLADHGALDVAEYLLQLDAQQIMALRGLARVMLR